jgi:signal transduction histidine kinase
VRCLETAHRLGTGIRLAIVKAIAEPVAGAAWVEYSPLGGARFVLRVPWGIAFDLLT